MIHDFGGADDDMRIRRNNTHKIDRLKIKSKPEKRGAISYYTYCKSKRNLIS